MTGYSVDAMEFLQTVNQLERRFEEVTSPGALRKAMAEPESYDPVDHRLYVLAHDVFADTGWAMTIMVAAASFDGALVGQCKEFIQGCSSVVRKYGINVWLYGLANGSTVAMFTGEPSENTPMCIQTLHRSELVKRCRLKGPKRFGSKHNQQKVIREHCRQMHKLAAYTLMRWGDGSDPCIDTALMLLHEPAIGMCMLREDPKVLQVGAAPDMNFRRVVVALAELRARADEEFARESSAGLESGAESGSRTSLKTGQEPAQEPAQDDTQETAPDHVDYYKDPAYAQASARYLYDARRLIAGYRELWDRTTLDAAKVLVAIEQGEETSAGGASDDDSVWHNVVHLREVSRSLLGADNACELIEGFNERDVARFDQGVALLESMAEIVEMEGLPMLPIVMLDEQDGYVEKQSGVLPKSADDKRRKVSEIGEFLAGIVLARFPRGDVAKQCALALLDGEIVQYAKALRPMLRDDIEEMASAHT
ncbi:MAG: hypothetical protein LKF49_06400 [Bifidobacterium tibiigranuli]|uniref:hypothetical protein n=1 Tax=Bifidobacterium tibiigranuli TaxID=2172043 RepID=UPI002354D524|nr:hypothetical protein [Bifidobacterium tibiigranuli]MCH3973826.1 hypothetical protein [Bifidobacterium tibiigranuli]MCH4189394.1 hypothetical protein [Bifidobacterium tibiigranuli]MCH4203821.1 hypothetical protein [Bifidobacterium tibiigranuli]MCH4274337.1 hypothetical protein [Bifidobacterium tibiigranuli]MCI1791440.1 hypothetical protein [Bifidobacterium tibiigranuli]